VFWRHPASFPDRPKTTSSLPGVRLAPRSRATRAFKEVSLSRRSVVATLIAAFAPAAGTAVALPAVIKTAAVIAAPAAAASPLPVPTTESPDLLSLGAEIDAKPQAYRAAAARPEEARARRTRDKAQDRAQDLHTIMFDIRVRFAATRLPGSAALLCLRVDRLVGGFAHRDQLRTLRGGEVEADLVR
jgi:hypothetical protein